MRIKPFILAAALAVQAVAAFAQVEGDTCRLRGLYYDEGSGGYSIGEKTFYIEENDPAQGARMGRELAHELRDRYTEKR